MEKGVHSQLFYHKAKGMDSIQVLVVEDNQLHAEKIEMLLEDLDIEMVGCVDNALDAFDLLQSSQPDLILLDINISGSFTGIDFAERIRRTSNIPIIYISSIRDKETFNKAKATSPDAFVYKPIEEDALIAAIELAIHKKGGKTAGGEGGASKSEAVLQKMVFLRIGNSLKKILLDEIVYIQVSAKNYCDIRTVKKRYSVKSSLNELSNALHSDVFMRVSRSHILNLSFIEEINEKDALIETGFEPVTLGKGFKSSLYERLKKV